jgi:hypothetical protein
MIQLDTFSEDTCLIGRVSTVTGTVDTRPIVRIFVVFHAAVIEGLNCANNISLHYFTIKMLKNRSHQNIYLIIWRNIEDFRSNNLSKVASDRQLR